MLEQVPPGDGARPREGGDVVIGGRRNRRVGWRRGPMRMSVDAVGLGEGVHVRCIGEARGAALHELGPDGGRRCRAPWDLVGKAVGDVGVIVHCRPR